MNSNLNPAEFGQLFDTAPYVDVGAAQRAAQERNAGQPQKPTPYGGSAWSTERWADPETGEKPIIENPLYDIEGAKSVTKSFRENVNIMDADQREEFVHTLDVVTPQGALNPAAVEHQVQHSTGLDTPNIEVTAGAGPEEGRYALKDGNHRLNAALRRGQMFLPANVMGDSSRW